MSPAPKIVMEPTSTNEAHALRAHDIHVEIPEAKTSHMKWVVACKCGWMDYTLRSTADMRDAYRKHKANAVRFSRKGTW